MYLEGTKVKSIPALSKSIESLELSNNKICDISELKDLKNLKVLRLNDNQIKNLEPIRELKNLTVLEIKNNFVQYIDPIANLPKLSRLNIHGNPIEDFSCLKLPELSYLSFSGGVIEDNFNFLSENRALCTLDIENTDLSNVTVPIPRLQSLTDVTANRCQLKSLDIFINLTNLQRLDVRYNQIDDITALSNLDSLIFLSLKGNLITPNDLPKEWNGKTLKQVDIIQEEIPKETIPGWIDFP